MTSLRRRAALWALLACGVACLVAPAAQAGTYQVTACGAAPAGANRSWVASATNPSFLYTTRICPPTGDALSGLLVLDELGGPSNTPSGARAEWVFTAAPGTYVSGLSALRWLYTAGLSSIAYIRTGEGALLESCFRMLGFPDCKKGNASTDPPLPTVADFPGLATSGLAIGIVCAPAPEFPQSCLNGPAGGLHFSGAGLHAATVSVVDPTPPAVTAVSGSLRDAAGRGWLRSERLELAVGASDVGGGVAALAIGVDGRPAAESLVVCDYTLPAPCPASAGATLALETAALSDGPHTITGIAQDATRPLPGANATASAGWTVRVDNTAPGSAGLQSVAGASAGAPFDVAWIVPDQGVASPVVSSRYTLSATDGGAEALSGQAGPAGVSGLIVPRPGRWRLEVRLVDEAGNLGAPAAIDVAVGGQGPPPTGPASAPLTLHAGARPRVISGQLRVAVTPIAVARRMAVVFRLGRRVIGRRSALVGAGVDVFRVRLPTLALGAPGPVRVSWRRAGVAESFRSVRVRASAPAVRVIGQARRVGQRVVVRVVPHPWPRVARLRLTLAGRQLLVAGQLLPGRARVLVVPLSRLRPPRR